MKKLLIIITLMIFTTSAVANNDAVKGALILGAISLMAGATPVYDEVNNYKSYKINQVYIVKPSQELINVKDKVGISHQLKLIKDIPLDDNYKLTFGIDVISAKTDWFDVVEVKRTTQQIMKNEPIEYYKMKVDSNGYILDSDYPLLTKESIGKQFYRKAKTFTILKDTYSQEIIYSGIYKDKLHLTYREYKGNLIKSPYTQNLVFDLSLGKKISIGRFEIEILKATNNSLEFKVLNDKNY